MAALSMVRLLKVASPFDAARVNVPPSNPFLGLSPSATVTLLVAVVTRLPPASCTSTCTDGLITVPALVVEGCTKKASFVAPPIAMSKAGEIVPLRPAAVALSV